jgi:hypothetical protein
MRKKRKIKGGAEKMKAIVFNQYPIIDSANKEHTKKSDWADLADECNIIAKETGLTREHSKKLIKTARKILDDCNR